MSAMWWRLAERGVGFLVDAGFNLATRPRKSSEEREKELDQAIAALEKEEAPSGWPQENPGAPLIPLSLPTTEETVQELSRRLGKELYRMEMDLQAGGRIAGKPCDCLSHKHNLGLEATAEELMSYQRSPVYGKVVAWLRAHEAEFEPREIARRPPEHYQGLVAEVRAFRKEVLGTEKVKERVAGELEEGENPGNPGPNPAVRPVGVGPPPPRPFERPEARRRGLLPGTRIELITPDEEKRIRELKEQGLTYGQIAKQMHRSVSTVWRTVHREYPPLRRAITTERLRDTLLLRRMGLTEEEIGRRLGVSKPMVSVLLHRAGQRMDLSAAAQNLRMRLLVVSDRLGPPATLWKLEDGADRLREIADDAALLLEVQPHEVPEALEYPFDLGWVHSRALLAEEVLRNGAWCLLRQPVEPLSRVKERLGACGEAAREAARGIIERWDGYETKATAVIFEIEEMMAEEKAGVPT
jgi:DNA-binding CsgD family transcriptional regulator